MNQNCHVCHIIVSRIVTMLGNLCSQRPFWLIHDPIRCFFTLGLTVFVCSTVSAQADDAPVLTVFADVRYPADYVQTTTGQELPANSAGNLVQALLEASGIPYAVEVAPWSRAIQAVDSEPNVIVYSIVRTAERESRYYWIGQTRPVDIYLFGLRARAHELPTTLQQARDYRIGNLRANMVDDYLSSAGFTELVYFQDFSRSIAMLQRGRIDLIPFAEHGINQFLRLQEADSDLLVPMLRIEALATSLNIILSKRTDPEIAALLAETYQELVQSRRYEEIMGIEWQGGSAAR